MPRGLLLYDPDCGFCTRAARQVPRLRVDVDIEAMSQQHLAAHGIDPARAAREMPFVASDGSVSFGHRAWAGILATGPAPARLAGRVLAAPGVDRVAARAYRWIAEHRELLPGGTPQCALPQQTGSRP